MPRWRKWYAGEAERHYPHGGAGCRGSERKSYAPRRGITSCRTLTCRGGYAQACYAMVNATDRPSAAIYVSPGRAAGRWACPAQCRSHGPVAQTQ